MAVRNGGLEEFELILQIYNNAKTDSVRKWALNTLGHAPTTELKSRVLEWAISGDVKLQDCFYALTSVATSANRGSDIAWEFFKNNFDRIKTFTSSSSWTMQVMLYFVMLSVLHFICDPRIV